MNKIEKIEREDSRFVMSVRLGEGREARREVWTYEREESASGVSYSLISREDSK